MAFRIQNNTSSTNSLRHLETNTVNMNRSLERLSSGYRINSAADDAAGLASSMRFRAEVSSLKVASRNAQEATSLLQVAEGAMGQIDLILNRMKELATQASSGNAGTDRAKINQEASDLTTEIDRIVNFTEYSGSKLLDGNYGSVSVNTAVNLQPADGFTTWDVSNAKGSTTYTVTAVTAAGAGNAYIRINDATNGIQQTVTFNMTDVEAGETHELDFDHLGIKVTINENISTAAGESLVTAALGNAVFQIGDKGGAGAPAQYSKLGFSLSAVDMAHLDGGSTLTVNLATQSAAQTALGDIDDAISHLATQRGKVGALINRMSYANSNLAVSIENKTASESIIRDVDMASEMSSFTKNQILVQASTSMLAQANLAPQSVLNLVR